MTTLNAATIQQLEPKLKALKEKQYIPKSLLEIITRTVLMQLEAQPRAQCDIPTTGYASTSEHTKGTPLLYRELFPYDKALTAQLFGRLLGMLRNAGGAVSKAADTIKIRIEQGELSLEEACNAIIREDDTFFTEWAERMPNAISTLRFLIASSLVPSLAYVAEHIAKRRNASAVWTHGHCPLCGSSPFIGKTTEREGVSEHTCSFCRHSYAVPQEQCPYCLETDSNKLEKLTTESEPHAHIQACRTCDSYIKIMNFRGTQLVSVPVLDDLETLILDILANQQELERPTASAWGF